MKKLFAICMTMLLLFLPLSIKSSDIKNIHELEDESADPKARLASPLINKHLLWVHETYFLQIPSITQKTAKERALAQYKSSRKAINEEK